MNRNVFGRLASIGLLATFAASASIAHAPRTPEPNKQASYGELRMAWTKTLPLRTPVVFLPDEHDPAVYVRVVFRTGSRDDPPGKEGLAALSADLMTEATKRLSAAQLKARLFPWAANIGVQVDKDATVFIGKAPAREAWPFLSTFLQVIQSPRLDDSDFARLKADHISYLEKTLKSGSDENLAREVLEAELYGGATVARGGGAGVGIGKQLKGAHPYRHPPEGTAAGLAAITLGDVKAHITNMFSADRAMLGVAGGAVVAQVNFLRAGLAALPRSTFSRRLPPAPSTMTNAVVLIEKETSGTPISIGHHIGLSRRDADYPAMKLAETYFGEHRSRVGQLFNAMREVRGLNYGDYAYVEHFRQAGYSTSEQLNIGREQQYFSIWVRPVEHQNRHFAMRQAVYELEKFIENGIPDDESLERTKAFLAGYWLQKAQDPMRRLGYRLDDFFARSKWTRKSLLDRIQKLTRAEVNAAIKRHLRKDRLRIVAVTKGASAFRTALERNTPSPMTYPAKVDAAVLEEDKAIMNYNLNIRPRSVRVLPAKDLFLK